MLVLVVQYCRPRLSWHRPNLATCQNQILIDVMCDAAVCFMFLGLFVAQLLVVVVYFLYIFHFSKFLWTRHCCLRSTKRTWQRSKQTVHLFVLIIKNQFTWKRSTIGHKHCCIQRYYLQQCIAFLKFSSRWASHFPLRWWWQWDNNIVVVLKSLTEVVSSTVNIHRTTRGDEMVFNFPLCSTKYSFRPLSSTSSSPPSALTLNREPSRNFSILKKWSTNFQVASLTPKCLSIFLYQRRLSFHLVPSSHQHCRCLHYT